MPRRVLPIALVGPAAAASPAPSSSAPPATIGTRHTSVGTVLVDAHGHTLHLFEKDKGSTSTCDGGCAAAWPPLTTSTGDASAGETNGQGLDDFGAGWSVLAPSGDKIDKG